MLDRFSNNYGTDDAEKLMNKFCQVGNDVLLTLRNHVNNPEGRKKPRTWGNTEASKMVGVSDPTFRKIIERNEQIPGLSTENHRRWEKTNTYTLEAINFLRDKSGTRYKRPAGSQPLIIAVSNLKGGVGKTQTAVDLSKKIAIEGLRVLLLDFDAQGTATLLSSGFIPDLEIPYKNTITDSLLTDANRIKDVILRTNFDGLDIVPANLAIQDCELILPTQIQDKNKNNWNGLGHPYYRLTKVLDLVKENYDVILIDCGPNLGALTLNAILACNGMIIPLPPSMSDYSSFITYAATLRNLFKINNKQLEYLKILITKHTGNSKHIENNKEEAVKKNNGSKEARDMEALIRQQFANHVLANYMCDTIEVAKAAAEIGTIYDIVKPRGSKEAYRRAKQHLDDLNLEVIGHFKDIWTRQAEMAKTNKVEETHVI